MDGKWIFTLHNPSVMPFLQYADNRALREKIYNACDIRKFMKHLTDGTDSYRQERAKNLKQMHNKTENYCKRLADYLQL